ncbi:serine threonine- kinase pim-2-like protein [Labeo rohita]|uniref:non-specific serine/threonine protein kinase n=1 Tax=Labeo rohita TaxID=84645 RepID=A0A498P350_LABRO|nr:serine threonine- kinase pim-2-like protein [Labeo rohita]RXN38633.1 serine threonine- kinase pim-2-like protein [Labeo rohita]
MHVGSYKVTTSCALTDGETVYLSVRNGSDPEFEEGQSYVVKNFTLSHKYGRPCLFVNRATITFKTTPLAVTEEAIRTAKEALCPLSPYKTGEEDDDIFTHRGYLSLQGQIQKVEVARLTHAQVPILDLRIKCRSKLFDIALWREEALNELYVGDTVQLTHLKSTITPDGKRKSVSSNYTTVKIIDRHILEEEVEIIGVSQKDDTLILLDSGLDDFVVPAHFYAGNPHDLVKQLPLKLKIRHIQRHVVIKRMRKSNNRCTLHIPGCSRRLPTEMVLLLMLRRPPVCPYVIEMSITVLSTRALLQTPILRRANALGITLYMMVNMRPPFSSVREILQACIYIWKADISMVRCDLIYQCLDRSPMKRATFEQILQHE